MTTQLVRVTRTIRQTYYVTVENAGSKREACEQAVALVDEWGDRNDPLTSRSPWVGSSRALDCEPIVGIHAAIDTRDAKFVMSDNGAIRIKPVVR